MHLTQALADTSRMLAREGNTLLYVVLREISCFRHHSVAVSKWLFFTSSGMSCFYACVELHSLAKQWGTKTLGLLFKLNSLVDHTFRLQLVSQVLCFYLFQTQIITTQFSTSLNISPLLKFASSSMLHNSINGQTYKNVKYVKQANEWASRVHLSEQLYSN